MAGFEVISDLNDAQFQKVDVSSLTTTIGELLERTAGSTTWAACSATTDFFTPKAIAMEAVTSASSVLVYRLTGLETVKAVANNSSSTTHNGDRMTLITNAYTVSNTGSDVTGQAVCFVQEGVIGVTGDKRIVGRVLVGNGVDPDAS